MENLPGFPDNINMSSDGNYWMSLVGMRSPALDLAWTMPAVRRRMAKRVPQDEWLYPNVNTGCVLKFNDKGEVLETLWDLKGANHPQITSMREHKGSLFLGGLSNNRIGRYKLRDNADRNFVQYEARWRAET
jgi:ribose transport system permease protein